MKDGDASHLAEEGQFPTYLLSFIPIINLKRYPALNYLNLEEEHFVRSQKAHS